MSNKPTSRSLLASDIWALAHNRRNVGPLECHWCAGPCDNKWVHDAPPPIPFVRNNYFEKRPSNAYICVGCWLWRQPSVTVLYLDGEGRRKDAQPTLKDRQTAKKHSWLVTTENAWAIEPYDYTALYRFLLKPANRYWFLALQDPNNPLPTHLQLSVANFNVGITAETPLHYTINNVHHTYTVYELEEALRHPGTGKEPGIQALLDLLGPYPLPPLPQTEEDKKADRPGKPGPRPSDFAQQKKVIVKSGS